ncbi:MAG: response regulator transcription factor [Flavobacterium sp.]|uniref:response regulator transcription factor n=1 Tax=Flavobacterium sp. TaxID=239 RepID=UPI001DC85612|nr:response regulator transcription factor [Flavobacterium sp.]
MNNDIVMQAWRFIIADDHMVVRQGMAMLVKEIFPNAIIWQAENFTRVRELLKRENIDVLILDVSFPEGNSLSLLAEVRQNQPDCKIMIFSALEEEVHALHFYNAGVQAYINKLSDEEQIRKALVAVVSDGRYLSQLSKELLFQSYAEKKVMNPIRHLSERELEVARLMVKGFGNLEISNALQLQKTTISTYKKRIYEKLQIEHLAALIELFTHYHE